MSTFVDNRTQPLQSTLVDISIERVNKLPSVKPEDSDVYTLTSTVSTLRQHSASPSSRGPVETCTVGCLPAGFSHQGSLWLRGTELYGTVGLPACDVSRIIWNVTVSGCISGTQCSSWKKTCQPLQQVIPMQYLLANSVELSGRCPRENPTPTSLEAKLLTAN